MNKIVSAAEAVERIPDEAVVTVSSSSLGCPDLVLRALGERFDAGGHPRDLTTLHPIAAGDMYGVKGIDHIAREAPQFPRARTATRASRHSAKSATPNFREPENDGTDPDHRLGRSASANAF